MPGLPVAIGLRYWPGMKHPTALFVCSAIGIIPLAGLMGRATEQLSDRMGPAIGGLLNATFGNAAELIIGLMALQKGLIGVVKASLTGSIIGNVLFVLGVSVVAGGVRYREQAFNRTAVQTSTTSLMLAAIGLLIPTVFHYTSEVRPEGWNTATEHQLSLVIAAILLGTYILTQVFALITHKQLFLGVTDPSARRVEAASPKRSRTAALWVLVGATLFVAWLSEFLVGTVEAARSAWGVTETFIGVIVVAIIGNAAEHSTAVWMAMKNKLDLSLNIAVGSSLQIALFVAPVLVFVSGWFGQPMGLEFSIPEVVAVIVAVYIVSEIIADGRTNWLEGVQLLSVYLILATLFYFLPVAAQGN